MIAGVLLNTRSGVKPANWLADVHEGLVVAAACEPRSRDVDALLGVVVHEEFLDDVGTRRPREVVSAAVTVEDTKVPTGHHVKVQVCQNVVRGGRVQVLGVVFGSEETVLFGPPPREADFVLDFELFERSLELEDQGASRAICRRRSQLLRVQVEVSPKYRADQAMVRR